MFALGGDAFPNHTGGLCAALTLGAKPHGAADDAVTAEGNFPSLEVLRMNLTGVRLDARKPSAMATESAGGGFFSRTLDLTAEPALLAGVPLGVRLHGEDCVFAFGTAADGVRVASLQSCTNGTFDASATTKDLEGALLKFAREAAAEHGADVESVRLTLDAQEPHCIALTAVAVAKAMFLTATLTLRGRIVLDEDFALRVCDATCTGDGMIANLAAAQLRPQLAKLAQRAFSIRSFLPAGLCVQDISLSGGAALQVRAMFGSGT